MTRSRLTTLAVCALAVFMLVLTAALDVFCARNVLDGDMSEYMVRAAAMVEQNRLIPQDYALTSELRILDMPLVFSLFLRLGCSYAAARVLGTLLVQGLMVGAFAFLCRTAGASWRGTVLGCALLLMPFSTAYARIALYHAHYTLYLAQAFWMLALTLRLSSRSAARGRQIAMAVLLGVSWLLCGLNGVRHLMLLALPMLLIFGCLLLQTLRGNALPRLGQSQTLRFGLWLMIGLVCFLPGFVYNTRVLVPQLSVQAQHQTVFGGSVEAGRLLTMLNNLLHAIGGRVTKHSLLGLRGISLLCAFALFGGLYMLCVQHLRQKQCRSFAGQVLMLLPLCALAGTALLLLLVDGHEPEEWYFIPPLAFGLPALCLQLDAALGFSEKAEASALSQKAEKAEKAEKAAPPLSLQLRVLAVCVALCLCFQGAYTVLFMRSRGTNRMDAWTGLPLRSMQVVQELAPAAEYLLQNGDTRCMTVYWYAAPLTEMTNGAVQACAYYRSGDDEPMLTIHGYGMYLRPYQQGPLPETVPVLLPPHDRDCLQRQYPSAVQELSTGTFELWRVPTADIDFSLVNR